VDFDVNRAGAIQIFRIPQALGKNSTAMHQLFIGFQKEYGCVWRKDVYNILVV
jgi:hypothetical protein